MVDIVKFIRGVNLAEKQAELAVFAKNRRNPTEVQGKFLSLLQRLPAPRQPLTTALLFGLK